MAFEIKDYDHPVSEYYGKRFCEFMEFDDVETKKILSVCVSEELYNEWAAEEYERNNY